MPKLLIDIDDESKELRLWVNDKLVKNVTTITLSASAEVEPKDVEFDCVFVVRRELTGRERFVNINYYPEKGLSTPYIMQSSKHTHLDIDGFVGVSGDCNKCR